ncbi:MAG: peptidoglycan-binding domain-containing protein [Nostoc sp. EfeVER01]|nr:MULTISPECIES: peptidoglycan-binding domain-containing protein [unclassified Nostoc]MDZ7943696.1 peptidoglycan-binding domain-containing protein [Nostoc sp. EfeVER01]MDZ7991703.1 peptidoglycan-binding domain-containing protein [Nostoc sp. EspVER01]
MFILIQNLKSKIVRSVKDAIVSFQTSKKLHADGIVGIKTWIALL